MGIHVGAGNLHPCTALVQQIEDDRVRLMPDTLFYRRFAHVIEYDLRRQLAQQIRMFGDFLIRHVELHMPAILGDAFGERLYHVDGDHSGMRIANGEAYAAYAGIVEFF